jgi:hypothetical protein
VPRNLTREDLVSRKLDAILTVVQDLLIIEGTKAGIKKADLRRILSVDSNRLTRITKHIRSAKK